MSQMSISPEGVAEISEVAIVEEEIAEVSPKEARARRKAVGAAVIRALPEMLNNAQWGQTEKIREQMLGLSALLKDEYPSVAKLIEKRIPRSLSRERKIPDSLVFGSEPRHGFDAVILEEPVREQFHAVIREHELADELARFGLAPRHRILLEGPPGNGKTMVAEALAMELHLPFIQVKYGGMVDSHLGGTGKNISQILEFAASSPCVLFADEFDGLGSSRQKTGDVGEMRRITNQLLIELERLPPHTVFVAATNMLDLMDKALLRRFDFTIRIDRPSPCVISRCVRHELRAEITPGHDALGYAAEIEKIPFMSVFAIVEACRQIRRDLVLNGGANIPAIVETAATMAASSDDGVLSAPACCAA